MVGPTRFLVVAALLAGGTTMGPPAGAEGGRPSPAPLPAGRLAAAVAAAHTARAVSIALTNLEQGGRPRPATVAVAGLGIPVYEFSPAFIRGDQAAPVVQPAYVAVPAAAPDGRKVTMQVVPEPAGWSVTGALSGDDEARLVGQVPPGGFLVNEPQINGWLALSGGEVRLLQASLPDGAAGAATSLHDYQLRLQQRYAVPHTDAHGHREIGFVQRTPEPGPSDPASNRSMPVWWIAGLAGLLLLVAASNVVVTRRKAARASSGREGAGPDLEPEVKTGTGCAP
ncbi:hypothetical protein [Amycolatopsis sp. PS_44_ISF1]|uniref:hypothetical protein n=1 Tax=Amycolatopsis sp. PS_44_ISF1 TaxID=2974917 RepID=UPI0028DF1C12|nr:hypothetical protein [Amycolatopsis sp. PS_44_ISF1]MDT8913031.1 hypothetical protein [Amycolatopsis sp. PS_44_ISF1]